MNKKDDLQGKIELFHQYLRKNIVMEKLRYLKKFSNFKEVYSDLRNDKDDVSTTVSKTLVHGIKQNIIDEYDLDELLFLILEDSLFNSFLYKINSQSVLDSHTQDSIQELINSWEVPSRQEILSNIGTTRSTKDFIISGYRIADDENGLESLRLLLLDNKVINISVKNEDPKEIIFPTIVEIDFRRNLLHIRLRDVDNIIRESEKISTMSGRIQNTLDFISSLKPSINYEKFENFKSTLFDLEEYLLSTKRNSALQKLEEFEDEIASFTDKVCQKFTPPSNHEISPRNYINTGVLSIIATTLGTNELGDVVGIRFKDTQAEEKKFAEITIRDSGNKCISTSNLYWLNLSVLQTTEKVEFLKILTHLNSGVAFVNLEFALETANIRILQRNFYDGEDSTKPSQEKYDDFLDFLLPYLS
ncbi:hypothetical protein ACQCVP_19920 [Rossellomorea vietnamensis]|uniref:hypothetical protein n=1 Tax=Rossellomorea vietnamensis TaxID=218284 RepID=UPI003CF5A874